MALSEADKRLAIDTTIKVGLVIWVASIVKKFLPLPEPGLTHRIPFDLEKTQNRYLPLGNDQYEVIPDPWLPNDLARRAHTIFIGVSLMSEGHTEIYDEISRQGKDRVIWLHNYWLDEVDPSNTLYRWIDDEWVVFADDPLLQEDKDERRAKENVMANMRRWGVGF